MACACASLNALLYMDLYGYIGHGPQQQPGKVHASALGNLHDKVRSFLEGETPASFTFGEIIRHLKEKRTSYTGETRAS